MNMPVSPHHALPAATRNFYQQVLFILNESSIHFLVGGAYALDRLAGIERHTKDLDIFVRPTDAPRVLDLFAMHGYRVELTFPHWLGKIFHDHALVDVIFSSGNGVATVDDGWFIHSTPDKVLGVPVQLCPGEEMIWSKGFVMERERYDGADICHLIRARAHQLDWSRLLRRFGQHWRVLFNHLLLFGYVYPDERNKVPAAIMEDLCGRLQNELTQPPPREHLCQGTMLSREQYLVDLAHWGYEDARLEPRGPMTPAAIRRWTEAIYGP
jgi:hypothetical protein